MLCEALFVRVADEVVTTSPGYADVIARRYRVPSPTPGARNVPDRPVRTTMQEEDTPLVTYFGAVTRHRGLGAAIAAMGHLPAVRLRIVGPDAWGFRAELETLAQRLGVADRVDLLPPVPPDRAIEVLSQAQVGLALIEPSCLSYELTLPNKIFEYVMAGVPVLGSTVPVLAGFIRRHDVGLTVDPHNPEAIANCIARLMKPDLQARFRSAANDLADTLSWDDEREVLAATYRRVGTGPSF